MMMIQGEHRKAHLLRCGQNFFQDNTPNYSQEKTHWTSLSFPENFALPLRCLETTWSCTFLVDNQGYIFYRGPYFLQDWEHSNYREKKDSLVSTDWNRLENPDIHNVQCLCASSNVLVVIGDGGRKLVVFPPLKKSSSLPSKHYWLTWDSNSYQSVAVGRGYFLVVTTSGDVYGWGTNDYGQLGVGWEILDDQSVHIYCNYFHQLTRIEAIPQGMAQKVACCDMSSVVLLKNGQVIVFGNNLYLQLGTCVCCPIQIPESLKVFHGDYPALDIALNSWQLAIISSNSENNGGDLWLSGKEPIHPFFQSSSSSRLEIQSHFPPPLSIISIHKSRSMEETRNNNYFHIVAGKRYFLLQTPCEIYVYGSGWSDPIVSYDDNRRREKQDWILLRQWPSNTQRLVVSGAENDIVIYYEDK